MLIFLTFNDARLDTIILVTSVKAILATYTYQEQVTTNSYSEASNLYSTFKVRYPTGQPIIIPMIDVDIF